MVVTNYSDIYNKGWMIYFIDSNLSGLLILTKGYWTDNLQDLELTRNKLKGKGIKCNIKVSLFGQTKMEYLVFWVTHNGVKSTNTKIEARTNMKPPTSQK